MENFKPKKILQSSLSLGIRRTPLGLVQSCVIENIRESLKRKENPHWSRGWEILISSVGDDRMWAKIKTQQKP